MPGLDEPWVIIPMMYRIHFIPIVRLVINILVEVVYVLELIQDEEWILIMHIMFWRSNYIKNDGGLTSIWVLGSIKKNAGYQTHRWLPNTSMVWRLTR